MDRRGVLRLAAAGLAAGVTGSRSAGLTRAQSAAEEVWRFGTGGTNPAPTVAGGTVYAGDVGGNLYALAAADGTEQWRLELGQTIVYSPTVARGTVYVGTSKGDLLAVDAGDGTERWRFGTGGMIQKPPTVVGGTVYFGSDDTYLYALAASAGEEQWRFKTSEATTGRAAGIESTPAVADGTVYVVNLDENLYAVEAATGEELWRFGVGRYADGLPVVADGTVYVGGGASNVYAVDAATGEEVWQYETSARRVYSPKLSGGVLYVAIADNSEVGGVYALDAATGEEQWRFGASNSFESAPALGDGLVYAGTSGNKLYAVGAPAAEAPATATPTASPTQSGPVAGSGDGGDDGGSGGSEEEGANRVGDPGSTAFGPEDVPWTVVGGGVVVGAGALGLKLLGGSTGSETTAGAASASPRTESDDEDDDEDDETEVAVVQEVDPLSAASWATQPTMKCLEERYRDDVEVSYEPAPVRRFEDPGAARERWAAVAETTALPVDPSFWDRDPPASTELVNRAFGAAVELDRGHRYVRALWRHAVAAGEPLDRETLVDTAAEVGLDPERFRRELDDATVSTGGQRSALPFTVVEVDGVPVPETGRVEYADLVATLGDGATGGSLPDLSEFLAARGPVATAEMAAVYGIDRTEAAGRLEGLDDVTTTEVGGERFWTRG